MAKTPTTPRALDANEARLVEQSNSLQDLSQRELTELARQLRARRERVRRMVRDRNRVARRQGGQNPDTGAHEKKAVLVEAIERVSRELDARQPDHQGTAVTAPKAKPASKAAAKPKAEAKAKSATKAPAKSKPAPKSKD